MVVLCWVLCLVCAGGAGAFQTGPQWTVTPVATPTVFTTGGGGGGFYWVTVDNSGDASSNGEKITITDALPAGLKPTGTVWGKELISETALNCTGTTCTYEGVVPADDELTMKIPVEVRPGAVSGEVDTVVVSGGGAGVVSRSVPLEVSSLPVFPGFGPAPDAFSLVLSNMQAGDHADLTTSYYYNTESHGNVDGNQKDPDIVQAAGFAGDPTATPDCTAAQLEAKGNYESECPVDSQVGTIAITLNIRAALGTEDALLVKTVDPVYSMEGLGGEVERLGFKIIGVATNVVVSVLPGSYQLNTVAPNVYGGLEVQGVQLSVWGIPALESHNPMRGLSCISSLEGGGECSGGGLAYTGHSVPFVSNPTQCSTLLTAAFRVDTWQSPGLPVEPMQTWSMGTLSGCDALGFSPGISLQPTAEAAETPTGLNVSLTLPQTYGGDPAALATAALEDSTVMLPEGMTINPSVGAGLAGCTEAEFAAEALETRPGRGCPNDSSLGAVTIETPVLKELATGSMYVAEPYKNPFGSLLALYVVARIPARGILVKVAGRIVPNPVTGQLVTVFQDTPQLPFDRFTLSFRPGEAAPLVTPPVCGAFSGQALFTSWAEPEEVLGDASPAFAITQGVRGGECPSGGVPPFDPKIVSGTISNAAGTYSPFYLRIIREDGEQEITHFTTVLPPGLSGNLSGIPFCPEADIEAAKHVTGREELEHPSCPTASEIGHTLVGAGVGPLLAETPGKLYLAGPYHGSGLSVVSITSAVVGPFDLGTVVIRFALRIDPTSAQVEIDGSKSDAIPHIIDGIVVHVRDIRVYIDRPDFILNPTNCNPMSISAAVQGAGLSPANPVGAATVTATSPFQTADCSSLKFEPRFKVSTSARSSRTDGESLTAKLSYPEAPLGHQANIARVKVELPGQLPSRLTTLQKACKAVIFEANPAGCPAASIVGHATASTPILPTPLTGPAYFVSHGGEAFPSLIIVLQGYGDVTIDLVGSTYINKAGITSSTFKTVPDVSVGSFELTLPKGPYSALTTSGDLCKSRLLMPTEFVAQNGVVIREKTTIAVNGCPKGRKVSHKRRRSLGRKAGRGPAGRGGRSTERR
jgi:uncharacterized repeat protein (TIGR01451 family)